MFSNVDLQTLEILFFFFFAPSNLLLQMYFRMPVIVQLNQKYSLRFKTFVSQFLSIFFYLVVTVDQLPLKHKNIA